LLRFGIRLGDEASQPATLHQAFRQVAVGTHLIGIHGLSIGHVHAIVVEHFAGLEIALGDGADFGRRTAKRPGGRIAEQNCAGNRAWSFKM
jgi:hypothetical protein